MGRKLIRGGCVLSLGTKTPNYAQADVLIDDDRIAEIGPNLRARDAETIDAADAIVMPGFVDGHRHASMGLFRNSGADRADVDRLPMTPDDVYAATLISLLGCVEAGITTVVDWSDPSGNAATAEAALQAHADAGLRTVFVSPAVAVGDVATALHASPGPSTTIALGAPDIHGDSVDRLVEVLQAGRQAGLRSHAHAGLRPEDAGLVATLSDRGALGSDVTLVHGSHLGDADLDAVAAGQIPVVLTPSTEMTTGLGFPPLQKLLDRKIQPGLGVDDELLAPGDMFAQMRLANSIQHAAYFDLKLAGKAGLPNLLTTRDIIRYATVEGARAAGLAAATGSLEPGKQGDVIVLRTDRANIHPINDPIGAVVWGLDTSNIDCVVAAGNVLLRDGVLTGDLERARRLAVEARDRVMAGTGGR